MNIKKNGVWYTEKEHDRIFKKKVKVKEVKEPKKSFQEKTVDELEKK